MGEESRELAKKRAVLQAALEAEFWDPLKGRPWDNDLLNQIRQDMREITHRVGEVYPLQRPGLYFLWFVVMGDVWVTMLATGNVAHAAEHAGSTHSGKTVEELYKRYVAQFRGSNHG